MSLAVLGTTFAIVFPAELPDKTALAGLLLGTRYRGSWVFAGVAAAFACHVVLAVAAGSLLLLLPHRAVDGIVGTLFLVGAMLLLRGRHEEEDSEEVLRGREAVTFGQVSSTSFGIILLAEFGDLTQIVTANLAARYDDPLAVGIGATLGLWAVGGLAIVGGKALLRVVPLGLIVKIAASAMLVLAALSLSSAVRG